MERLKFNGKYMENLVLDVIKERVIFVNKDFEILYVNKSVEESLNLPKEEIIGRKCYEVWHKRNTPCEYCLIKKVKISKRFEEQEMKNQEGKVLYFKVYPIKGENSDEITGFVEIVQDITEKKRMEEEIKYLSFHDKLTGLYNRAFFEEELRRLDTERQLPISILMGDLNGLKLVNDAFGHEKGDELLKAVAWVLKTSCRKEDIIARWGGDEFIIIFPKTPKDVTEKICQRIRENCESYNKNTKNAVPLSIALGSATKEDGKEDINEIIKKAEDRMYRNKLTEGKTFRDSVLKALKQLLWENTFESSEHEERIKNLAKKMADILLLSDIEREALELLSYFHDIGEISLPSEIIKKPLSLTEEEFKKVKVHPEVGYRIAEVSYELAPIAEYILTHHEWWNGEGYPRGLKKDEIPLVSRIFSIVDAFEVMTSGRPYKEAKTKKEAIEELRKFAGIQFDPNLVEVFITLIGE